MSDSLWSNLVNPLVQDWEANAHQRRTYYTILRQQYPKYVTLLDVGCGIGFDCPRLREMGFDYTGIDLTPEMLTRARERNPDARFEQGDVTKRLPFPDESFDLVVSHDVLIHIDDFTAALDELWRVARKAVILRLSYTNGVGNIRGCDLDRGILNVWRNWSYVVHHLTMMVPPPASISVAKVQRDEMLQDSHECQIFEARKGAL